MISSCRCYGVPDLPQVPSPSSSGSVTSCLGVNFIACALFLFHVPLFVVCCWFYWSFIAVDTDNISLHLLRHPLLSHKHTHTHTHTHTHHKTLSFFYVKHISKQSICIHSLYKASHISISREIIYADKTTLISLPTTFLYSKYK
jgi:hypothetical protein